jgi:hypothetical protein
MGMLEVIDDSREITHRSKKTMQEHQRFTLPFLNKLILAIFFYFVW